MPASDIGIDLGTRNSQVYSTGKGLVLMEPTVAVYDKDSEKIKAMGEEAKQMAGHVSSNMEIIWPIRQGVIIDYTVMEKMLKFFISRAMGRRAFRKPRISICIPSGTTEIEKKAIEEATYQAGAREVFLADEPIAAAIGAGVDVTKPFGNLIVDIGAGTTDIAVISMAGVVVSSSIKVAGDNFNQAIMGYVRKAHNLFIGEDAAERIKIKIGTAIEEASPRTMEVKGRNVITGLRLSDGRDTIQITAPIRWFVYVFAILPFILVMVLGNNRVVAEVFPVVGGAIGGGIGGLMTAVALYAAGRLRSPLLQIAVCIAITAVTVLICWGIGSAIVAAAT